MADDAWYDRFLVCFETLERRLADGGLDPESLACCTGEEMALHLTVGMVETLFETGGLDDLTWMASLPPWRAEDDDAERARSVLFRDHDVLWLFEASLDGAEVPDSEESAYYGLAHLHPRDWLNRFDGCPQRHARAGVDLASAQSTHWPNEALLEGRKPLPLPLRRFSAGG